MNSQLERKKSRAVSTKVIYISLITFSLLMLAIATQLLYSLLSSDRIYAGVRVGDIEAGGMTYSQLFEALSQKYGHIKSNTLLTLVCKDERLDIDYEELGVSFNIEETIEKAFSVGRSGNIFNRLADIARTSHHGFTLDIKAEYDRDKLENLADVLSDRIFINVRQPELIIQDNRVIIRSGRRGESIDRNKLMEEVDRAIKELRGGEITVPVIETLPDAINADDLYSQIIQEEKNATIKVVNNEIEILPHSVGRHIDKDILVSIVEDLNQSEDTEKVLPVVFVEPKVTTEKLKAMMFKDLLARYETRFYTRNQNEINRSENIRLAASKINGTILAPGEEFSFNNIVGKRTAQGGYKDAFIYVNGKVVSDIGGGICQVSSTLYNAALYADLEIVERQEHMFTVAYVPLGQDAAVAYGYVDFRFRNSTDWPIKIEANVTNDNRLIFSIYGTNENPGKTIEIVNKTVAVKEFKETIIDDPNLEEGTTIVEQEGWMGYDVDTYKIVKINGTVVSNTYLYRSRYSPLTQEVRRGTKKVEGATPTPSPSIVPSPTPVPSPAPSNEASPTPSTKPTPSSSPSVAPSATPSPSAAPSAPPTLSPSPAPSEPSGRPSETASPVTDGTPSPTPTVLPEPSIIE